MQENFVKINFDLFCDWRKEPPVYRIYVNNELFTERAYIWGGSQYLEEILQIRAPAGRYNIRVDNLGDPTAIFKARNLRVEFGPATIIDSKTFEVYNENT